MRSIRRLHRREMLGISAAAGLSTLALPAIAQDKSPNEKLSIAGIGVGGQGGWDIGNCASEDIVALCDVDDRRCEATVKKFPKAKRYRDFRKMLEEMDGQIDAVVVGTPDHVHAPASAMAMRMGKHCYCEKPLTHTVREARVLAQIANENKRATQMGTQIHAGANYRRVVELVRAGAIGPIREVHVWLGAKFDGPPKPVDVKQPDAPKETPAVPDTLDWDLWLGPASFRPYHDRYVPFHWRYWWAFGNGSLGDFFCHYCDLAFWALELRHPLSVEAEGPVHPESTALWTIAHQDYPARGDLPPVTLTWYHGGAHPAWVKEKGIPTYGSAVLFVGAEGMLISDYGKHQLLPEDKFKDYQRPPASIPDSIGHHAEWIQACKTGGPTTCNFDYAGALTEAALLCNVALKTGKKLQWDAANLKAVNCPEADRFIHKAYREGWAL
ncbi:MAG: Gfo/Idh/MocA family oxidoreductase [Pirellulaceae bacterium]|jgi:predicted dehydrogenase|nr:Gfo/Idh/MocA family oxidoreductase [Thermoguttaceae bacterium]MDI9444019.1 Gfo/Idh/MocA family oxidoreductase [Planctomycetota bacterium]NLZ01241.1 Gfo/Idh/MocA family oxidoreductase [Pirellulaceae bacterium]